MKTQKFRKDSHGSKIECPECGGPMDRRAKRCHSCWSSGRTPRPKDTCPECGNPKTVSAKLCYSCSHTRKEPEPKSGIRKTKFVTPQLDKNWLRQFCGFFLADGCCTYNSGGKKPGASPSPLLVINLRADDRPWLEEVSGVLGGKLYEYDPQTSTNSKTQCRWIAYGYTRILPIVTAILEVCTIPARKVEELRIMKEWCEWRISWGAWFGDDGRLINQEFADRLSKAKVFKVQPG